MKRREFMALLGGAAAWPLAARAQQPRLPTIGYLGVGTPSSHSQWLAAFSQRLRELGWIEGRTVALETRWAEGHSARFAEIIAEFVQMKVDVIVAPGATLLAAKQAASTTTPIVFPVAADPVGSGLVASLAQPGGNVTGLSLQQADAAGKRLEILRELLPDFRRLAVMANAGSSGAAIDAAEAEAAARSCASRPSHWISGERKILRRPSKPSRVGPTHSTSWGTRSLSPTGCASTSWRSLRDSR